MNGHPRFYELIDEMKQLHSDKNHDYAGDDPLSNLKACERVGIRPSVGCWIRIQDKISRNETFLNKGEFKVNESRKDTLLDMATYCLLNIVLLEEEEVIAKQQHAQAGSTPTACMARALAQASPAPPIGGYRENAMVGRQAGTMDGAVPDDVRVGDTINGAYIGERHD